MSLSEKMNLWDSRAATDPEPISDLDTLFCGVKDDEEESVNLAGLSDYNNAICESQALAWLVASLRNILLLQSGSEGMGDLAANRIRETIMESLPTGKISKREPLRQFQVCFRLEWGHLMDQSPGALTDRLDTNVIAVCSGKAQLTSVMGYLRQTCLLGGRLVLDLLERTAWLKRESPDASGEESYPSDGRLRFPRC